MIVNSLNTVHKIRNSEIYIKFDVGSRIPVNSVCSNKSSLNKFWSNVYNFMFLDVRVNFNLLLSKYSEHKCQNKSWELVQGFWPQVISKCGIQFKVQVHQNKELNIL